jgi:anti-sigma regulatory factor (Ser/Thr protein kinase)
MQFTSSGKGAQLARRVAVRRLREWGYATDTPALLIGELTANAVEHCHAPGRDFRLQLTVRPDATLRIEVSDACTDHHPELVKPPDDAESGRGMLLIDALSTAWGSHARAPEAGIGKTVWCERALSLNDMRP